MKSALDKFYTNPNIVADLLEVLYRYTSNIEVFIEPSAGDGSFYNKLPSNRIGYDILPEHANIQQQDWFNVQKIPKHSCIVGNPPFGINNKLSKKFINHSINLGADIIAFVLPNVYNKPSIQHIFPPNFNLVENIKLRPYSFLLNDIEYNVPCSFQIWIKDYNKIDLRFKTIYTNKNEYFEIVKTKGDFFVFGAAPKNIISSNDVTKNNRGYHIKVLCNNIDEIKDAFLAIDWNKYGNSSVSGGVFWLTKAELLQYFVDGIEDLKLTLKKEESLVTY